MPLVLTLLALLAMAAPAAAQWGPAQTVAEEGEPLSLRFAANGSAVASGLDWLAPRTPSGRWTAPCELPRGSIVAPVTYGRSRMIVGRLRGGRLAVGFGRVRSCIPRAFRVVATSRHRVVHPQLAAGRSGLAALVWWEDRGTHNDRVRVALRRPGKGFGRPLRLAQERVRYATVAVGESGHVLVAWEARGRVRVRFKRPGRPFGRVQTIDSLRTYGAQVRAAVGPDGRAFLGWTAQFRSEGGDVGPAIVQTAVRPDDAPRFRRAQLLERFEGRTIENGRLDLAIDARGNATVAWTGKLGIETARSNPTGRFSIEQRIADGEVTLADLAVSDADAAVVLWNAGPEGGGELLAAYRPSGEIFGPPEPVASLGFAAHSAFPPLSETPTAVWAEPTGVRAADRG